ncbi:ARF GTPase-activating protein GIT2-like [Teleopsis dalmanni]|uniref:ARF GTPase-activating protein GIT2-like n=1 Tax=Teleopsis dalmanni TaxID=139649 RepID=UPI0018CFCF03|nr:ARF GTPase-activating protein GIT2-like [Teleopsis dalmanni]
MGDKAVRIAAYILRYVKENFSWFKFTADLQVDAVAVHVTVEREIRPAPDPNFYHEEKCSTPLHVAAKFGQASQIELLLVYGADINAIDGNGLAPLEVAKANNHSTIAERLLDAMYDVTDRIIMFLGGKKPDHASGRHLVIPELSNADISEQLKIARGKLQLVPNKMFEELVMDLYDEVDRRENEAIWATSTMNAENAAVPFLPANPFLSATRNQGRQKLARFSRSEFAGLLTDVLVDARRRQNMANLRPLEANTSVCYAPQTTTAFNTSEHDPNLSDDEPIYDPVASDDDYAAVPPIAQQSSPNTSQESQVEMETLRKQINKYVTEINQLKTEVQKLSTENSHLKSKFSNVPQNATSVYDEPLRIDLNGSENEHPEPHSLPLENSSVVGSNSSSSSSATSSNQSTIKRPASMYERRLTNATGKAGEVCRTTTSMYQMQADKSQTNFADEVKRRTDLVARCLKELIVTMRDASNKEAIVPCAERIHAAVMELMAIFTTTTNCSATVNETLKSLTHYNVLLQRECENLQKSFDSEDKTAAEKCGKEVRECAYFIAKAVKTLVVYHE